MLTLGPQSPIPNPPSRWWIILGVTGLAIAGLFSLVLAGARTSDSPLLARLFHQALVVHVDLSVLVWFLCIACAMWSVMASGSRQVIPYLEESALLCFGIGMAALTLSPLDPDGEALMVNYIPVLHSPVFFLGLMLVLCGLVLMLVRLGTGSYMMPPYAPLHYALLSAGMITLFALIVFVRAYWQLSLLPQSERPVDMEYYYEVLFWGGGHILQFTHTQILMVCWIMLAAAISPGLRIAKGWLYALFTVGLLASFIMAALPPKDIMSPEYRQFYTDAMIWGNGIAPAILALVIIPVLWRKRDERKGPKRALWAMMLMSIILFLYGGLLGEMIQGQNVVIPAHYHGSIVGVTLAFMGMAYALLPSFGYRDPAGWRLAYWQPIIYGGGQILHVSALAWSGGYGVLRKTPGGMDALEPSVRTALKLMGAGAGIAAIGGLMFVVVFIMAMRTGKEKNIE